MWSDIILARYGNVNLAVLGGSCVSRKASLWWRDVCAIMEPLNIDLSQSNWFFSSISCKVGNGRILDFLRHFWLESSSFDILFPSLFCLCGSICLRVCDVRVWVNDSWKWDLGLNGFVLSVEDSSSLEELMLILHDVKPNVSVEDRFV